RSAMAELSSAGCILLSSNSVGFGTIWIMWPSDSVDRTWCSSTIRHGTPDALLASMVGAAGAVDGIVIRRLPSVTGPRRSYTVASRCELISGNFAVGLERRPQPFGWGLLLFKPAQADQCKPKPALE